MTRISNHQHKIEEKSTKISRSSYKVVGLGLADLWEFPTLLALVCFDHVISYPGFMWLIHPYPSGLFHWHLGNRASEATLKDMGKMNCNQKPIQTQNNSLRPSDAYMRQ